MIIEEAREEIRAIRGGRSAEEYADDVWRRRYPGPQPRSGRGWPLKRLSIGPDRR